MKLELKNTDSLDIENVLIKAEKSFGIKFQENELSHVNTFGEFVDYFVNKITYQDIQDCSSQQAFYKLRKAILTDKTLNSDLVVPNALLEDVFPRQNRKEKIKHIENEIGFKLSILQAPTWQKSLLLILMFIAFFFMFINFTIGLSAFVVLVFVMIITVKNGIDFNISTLREVAQQMIKENYQKSRTNSNSFSKNEVENILTTWFKEELGLDHLNRDSTF